MAMKFARKKNVNAMRISIKVAVTVLALYAGGYLLTVLQTVMNGTCSPYYVGLKLIGWTVGTATCTTTSASSANTITGTSSTSILSVIGLLAIVWIVFEFVDIKAY